MKFGLSDSEHRILKETLFIPMKDRNVKLWIFGSRARGDQQKFSDIDILFDTSGSDISKTDIYKIKDGLEESRFPYKVDLVDIKELAEAYKDNVLRERVEL